MPAEEFRRQLRTEARQWLEEGIVDSSQYAQLAQRYDWDALARPSRHRALGIFVGLGTVLLGVGIAALVLANWQAMSRSLKIFMLVCLLVGVNWVGFALWRWSQEHIQHREGWQTSLGQSLLVAGSLVLGADMVLVGQLFHSRRSLAELFLIWALGVWVMACGLRATLLGFLALVLVALGWWYGRSSIFSASEGAAWLSLPVQHLPLLIGGFFLPLAYLCRSRSLFALVAVAFVGALTFQMAIALPADIAVLGCAVLPPALLWGYSDRLWCWGQRGGAPLFQPVARRLAVLFLAFLLYLLSFPWFWQRIAIRSETTFFPELPWFTIADIVITTGITLIEWIHTTYVSLTRQLSAQAQMHTVGVAAILTACALAVYWRLGIAPLEDGTGAIARTQGVTAIFAVLFLLLASELIRSGWRLGERSLFVGGTALLTLRAYAQALPHLQGLVAMALVFLICGGGTLALGLWFEQVARHRESVSLSRSLSNPMSAPEDAP